MALKPRTFRRIILLGSFVSVLVLVSVLYFVVRPWQNQRQLDASRVDGMAAAQAGDHAEAVGKLGRYLRQYPNAEPEYYLLHARSRLKYQAADGGHVGVAIQSYREYLKAVPDDLVAGKELLPLFNDPHVGMYIEAQSLAKSLRTKFNDPSLEVIREELVAHFELKSDNDVIEPLLILSVEHEDVEFQDLYQYAQWMREQDRDDETLALVNSRIDSVGGSVDTQLIVFWMKALEKTDLTIEEFRIDQVEYLASIIGLDPGTREWDSEPVFLRPDTMVPFIDLVFNIHNRQDLSLAVRRSSASINKDTQSLIWISRRLYWTHDFDSLYEVEAVNAEGESVPDVLGYQVLAHRQSGDDEDVASLITELGTIELDFRAQAWNELFKGLEMLDAKQYLQAHGFVKNAIESYNFDPVFHLVMGDALSGQGQFNLAREEWELANKLSNSMIGNMQWPDPFIRIIGAYTKADRLAEAMGYIDELNSKIAPQNPISTLISMRSYASLARTAGLDAAIAQGVIDGYERVEEALVPEEKSLLSAEIATLYASVGQRDKAALVLQEAVSFAPGQQVLLEILAVDRYYKLGVAESAGIDVAQAVLSTPASALRYALSLYAEAQDIEVGLEFLDRGADGVEEEVAYQWAKMRARYLDTTIDPIDPDTEIQEEVDQRAGQAWKALQGEHPEDIELFYQVAESRALSRDIDAVDAVIAQIVEMTSTKGKVLPSRLRLARASAIAGQGELTRTRRDQALEIIRTVVVSERKNTRARNMLGRLLEKKPSLSLTDPEEMFEPDYQGAINEYVVISRQLKGRAAQNYLLQAIDLSTQINEEDAAKEYLFEFDSRFPNDFSILHEVARRLENIGDLQTAGDIYLRIYQNAGSAEQTVDAGLSLANVYISQDQRRLAHGLLIEISELPTMEAQQLVGLASLYAKNGYKPEGDLIAERGGRYGLDPVESKMVYARYAGTYISSEVYESTLREVVAEDPTHERAWMLLIRRLIREQRFDEAKELATQAVASLPESQDIKAIAVLAQGDFDSASALIKSGAIDSNPVIDEAVRLVDEYMAAKENASSEELVSLLTSMLEKFNRFLPIQRFALAQLSRMQTISSQEVASYGDRAAKFFPSDSLLMRITSDAYLNAGLPNEALRIARLWRANVLGSPMEADVAIAQAYIQLDRNPEASDVLGVYINGAIEQSGDVLSAKVLYGYFYAKLVQGEDPQAIADRLEPLLLVSEGFGKQVWFDLIRNAVPTHEEAARWLGVISESCDEQEMITVARMWLVVINRFDTHVPEYAQKAIDILEPALESAPESPSQMSILAQAYAGYAKSSENMEHQKAAYNHAISLLDRANTVEPKNLAHLAQGASYATQAKDYVAAESRFRQLLVMGLGETLFAASIKNNIAVLIERRSSDPVELNEALQLSVQATEAIDLPSFWGTRGWVEMALGKSDQAESSFKKCINQDSLNLEGWVGLAIVQHLLGDERAEDAEDSFAQVRAFAKTKKLNADLLDRIEEHGDSGWISELSQD